MEALYVNNPPEEMINRIALVPLNTIKSMQTQKYLKQYGFSKGQSVQNAKRPPFFVQTNQFTIAFVRIRIPRATNVHLHDRQTNSHNL